MTKEEIIELIKIMHDEYFNNGIFFGIKELNHEKAKALMSGAAALSVLLDKIKEGDSNAS